MAATRKGKQKKGQRRAAAAAEPSAPKDGLQLAQLTQREHSILDSHLDAGEKETLMAQIDLDDEQVKYAEGKNLLIKFTVHLLTAMKSYDVWVPEWESVKFLKRRMFKAVLYDGSFLRNLHTFQLKMMEADPADQDVSLGEGDTIHEVVSDGLADACMFHYKLKPDTPGDSHHYRLDMILSGVTANNKNMQQAMIEEAKNRKAIASIADTSLADDPMLRSYQLLARNDASVQDDLQATVLHKEPPNRKAAAPKRAKASKRAADDDSAGLPLSPEKKFKNNVKRYGDKWSPERTKAFVVALTCRVCMDWLERRSKQENEALDEKEESYYTRSLQHHIMDLLNREPRLFEELEKEGKFPGITREYDYIVECMKYFPVYKDHDGNAFFRPKSQTVKKEDRDKKKEEATKETNADPTQPPDPEKEKWQFDGQDLKDKWKNIVRYFDKGNNWEPLPTLEKCRTLTLDEFDREMVTNASLILDSKKENKWLKPKGSFDAFEQELLAKFRLIRSQINEGIKAELERQCPEPIDEDEDEEDEETLDVDPNVDPNVDLDVDLDVDPEAAAEVAAAAAAAAEARANEAAKAAAVAEAANFPPIGAFVSVSEITQNRPKRSRKQPGSVRRTVRSKAEQLPALPPGTSVMDQMHLPQIQVSPLPAARLDSFRPTSPPQYLPQPYPVPPPPPFQYTNVGPPYPYHPQQYMNMGMDPGYQVYHHQQQRQQQQQQHAVAGHVPHPYHPSRLPPGMYEDQQEYKDNV